MPMLYCEKSAKRMSPTLPSVGNFSVNRHGRPRIVYLPSRSENTAYCEPPTFSVPATFLIVTVSPSSCGIVVGLATQTAF